MSMRIANLQSVTSIHGVCAYVRDDDGHTYEVPVTLEAARKLAPHLDKPMAVVAVPAGGGDFDGCSQRDMQDRLTRGFLVDDANEAYEVAVNLLRWCAAQQIAKTKEGK